MPPKKVIFFEQTKPFLRINFPEGPEFINITPCIFNFGIVNKPAGNRGLGSPVA
jgi:hypothetical protein